MPTAAATRRRPRPSGAAPPCPISADSADIVPAAEHRAWTATIGREELRRILNGDSQSRVGAKLQGLDVRHRDASGRASSVDVQGSEPRLLRGETLRAIVNRRLGDRALRSTRFSIGASNDGYTFHGTGFGHGVGLCQFGALVRARRRESLEAIFAGYFHGADLTRLLA